MEYCNDAPALQAGDPDGAKAASGRDMALPPQLTDANINPATGLATDYLNHFNEAIMLLEMLSSCPDCLADFQSWRPVSYREHFQHSGFKARDLAIAAYDAAAPAAREYLDQLTATMTSVIEATRTTISTERSPVAAAAVAERAAAWLKVLVARAGGVINGEIDLAQPNLPQVSVDRLMRHSA